MFSRRIVYRLTAGFVIIVLIAMLTVGMFFIRMFRQYALETREQLMLDRAHSIAEMMGDTGVSGNMRGMGGFTRFLNTLTDADVWILDAQGQPWVLNSMGMGAGFSQTHSLGKDPLPPAASAVIAQVLGGNDSVSESFSSIYNEATLTVGTPILGADRKVAGMVLLHAPVTGITETMNRATAILFISLGAALLVATGLGVAFSMSFTKPLKQMNAIALAMAGGNYDVRVDLSRRDELGQLGASLDLLAAELARTMDLLYQEKGKLEDVIASISEGIIAFDTALNPININANLGALMGQGDPCPIEAVTADFNGMGLREALLQVIQSKAPQKHLRTFNGKHLQFTLSPITNNKGMAIGAVALVQDVSESQRLEQLRRDFVANVSHEFRTPLTVIRGSLEALSDGTVSDPETVSRYIRRLLAETRGLERLVGDLLDLSRLQSDSLGLRMEAVHLTGLLQDTVKGILPLAEKKGIRILLDAEDEMPPMQGDYDRLRQLLVIFLDNAIKYSPENTTIDVSVKNQDAVRVSIADQGMGIAPEDLPYIWDRFYQSDTSRESSGTGLGLAIAKRLIDLHGGAVRVSSVVGKGTTFTITFPKG